MPAFDLYLPRTIAPSGARRRPIHPLAAAWMLFATWIERTRQRDALARLNDHQLRDLGITRVEAARECEKPFWR
jgi:uncharacterized protein YjiS (DUF1127 family)